MAVIARVKQDSVRPKQKRKNHEAFARHVLERDAAKDLARLLQQEEIEVDVEGESRDILEDGDGDRFKVESNGSYTSTEVYSDDDHQPRWSSLSPSSPALTPVPAPAPQTPRSHAHDVKDKFPTPPPRPPPQFASPSSLQLGPQVQLARGPLRQQDAVPQHRPSCRQPRPHLEL
ncbi:hypothetical protein BJV78DRAFT_1261814, partial [Lactifluus subvellereus]